MRRVAVITNARAGSISEGGHSLPDLLAAAGLDATFIPPDAGTLPERMQAAAALAADAVVVAGGDGTVACAAQLLAGTDTLLAVLPFGTMNLLAKDLGLPIGDTAAAIQVLVTGRPRRIDVGDVNGQVFLCASMLGLPARLARYREQTRGSTLKLWSRMGRAVVRSLVHFVPLRVVAEVDGRTVRLDTTAATVTVNPVAEATGARFARTSLDGGTLVLYVVKPVGLAGMAGFLLRVVSGRWRHDASVQEWAAPALAIGRLGRAMRVMNDGEVMMLEPPLRYRVRPRALLVMTP